jgi:hypothetical protein
MRQQPNAEAADLQRIQDWITEGITLDLESLPAAIDHKNTPSVLRNADLVRTRLREYMAFGAVVQLAADHPCPFGVQPLHVIIKEGKKPRLVIDLSQNLNDHLRYEYFCYSSVRDATELSTPAAGSASWTCPTVSSLSRCTRPLGRTSSSASRSSFISSREWRSA